MNIKGYDAGALLNKTLKEVWKDGVLGLSAQAAYSFFFSLFPILLFLAPLFRIGRRDSLKEIADAGFPRVRQTDGKCCCPAELRQNAQKRFDLA